MENFILSFLTWIMSLGYLGIALALMVEVIPSEIVLAYGGYLISQGKINFIGAMIAGTLGGTLAQIFLYWMGYYGGRTFLNKYGKYLLISQKHLNLAESWFYKYGPGVIFIARFIPVVRHAISIPAGIAKMSALRFSVYTTLAIIPWSAFFIYLGLKLGSNWRRIKEVAGPYTYSLAILALIALSLYVAIQWLKKQKPC